MTNPGPGERRPSAEAGPAGTYGPAGAGRPTAVGRAGAGGRPGEVRRAGGARKAGGVGNGGVRPATSPADAPTTALRRGEVDSQAPTVALQPDGNSAGHDDGGAAGVPHRADRRVAWHRATTGPIPVLPGETTGQRWRKVTGRTMSKAWDDSLFGMSSQAAFWCALSTAPLLLALLGLVSYVAPWFGSGTITQIHDQIMTFLNGIFNEEVATSLVGDTVNKILFEQRGDVVSIGLVISLWAGSSAMSAFVESITIAYGQHEIRHPVTERLFALALYLIALVAGIFLLPLLAIGPELLPKLFPQEWRDQVSTIVGWLYYPVMTIGLILLLATLYKVAPRHKHPWRRGLPGALLAAAVFLVASFGLRLYLSYVYSHGLTYGALATPITFLLFYYFISMAIVIGAQFNNATLEFYPPKQSKRALRRWRRLEAEDAAAEAEERAQADRTDRTDRPGRAGRTDRPDREDRA